MAEKKHIYLTEHPVASGSFTSWLRLLWRYKNIDTKYIPRALFVTFSTFATSFPRVYESIRYGRIVRNTVVHPSPIFIIGHWRTGTTHLHNILCRDKNFGILSVFQAMAPGLCLVGEGTFKRQAIKIQKKRHPTREIDNIPLAMDNPEENELAIAATSPYSFLHAYTFPRQAGAIFERYVLFNHIPESELAEWTDIYLTIVRKASLKAGGKQLLLKNCADSARIRYLLKIFPDAKFIHIYRNPYDVLRSTLYLYKTILPTSQLQEVSPEEIEVHVLQYYSQIMQRLLADKSLIPAGHLVEVKYEDLEKSPLNQVRKIYETLNLPGFDEAEPAFRAYLDSVAGYKKTPQKIEDRVIINVNRHWQFALDAWGYERLEPSGAK